MSEGPIWPFEHVWVCDTEFYAPPGEIQKPICVVAYDVITGKTERILTWGVKGLQPFYDDRSLVVAFYASAEMGTFQSLGWPRPNYIFDLYPEFKQLVSGFKKRQSGSLVAACTLLNIDGMRAHYKEDMRDRIIAGPPYSQKELLDIIKYCEMDVTVTTKLLEKLQKYYDGSRSLLRGRYTWSVASMERSGVPIDVELFRKMVAHWEDIKLHLIKTVDAEYNVYEGTTFKVQKFIRYLREHNIPWGTTPNGNPILTQDYFRERSKAFPSLNNLRELRVALGKLTLSGLVVGSDNRNRVLLSPYGSKTGRNYPSNTEFIFGPSIWMRNLITPEKGTALAYIDFSQQEFAIGAALSNDTDMMDAYNSGDPYLALAKKTGAVPQDATKESHKAIRDAYKTMVLGMNYGLGAFGLSARIGRSPIVAANLIRVYNTTFNQYWNWREAVADKGRLTGEMKTVFGWTFRTRGASRNTLRNFPMQANGAEMLRLSCIFCEEAGIKICAPVHDALLIESPEETIEESVSKTIDLMQKASRRVLGNFTVRAESEVVRYGERFSDVRGDAMWDIITRFLNDIEG